MYARQSKTLYVSLAW